MKKLLIFLLAIFTVVSGASALDINVTASNSEFYLFDRYGAAVDPYDPAIEEGLIVMTENEWVDLECQYGTVSMAPGSLLTVLSFDPDHPILYLVAGEASFSPAYDFYLEVYTPVSLISTKSKGEFYITTTEDLELILNLNAGEIRVLDGLTGQIQTLPGLTWANNVTGGNGTVSEEEYKAISRIQDRVFEETEEALVLPAFATEDPYSEEMTETVIPLTAVEPIAEGIEVETEETAPAEETETEEAPVEEAPAVPSKPDIIFSVKINDIAVPTVPVVTTGSVEETVPEIPAAPEVETTAELEAEEPAVEPVAEATEEDTEEVFVIESTLVPTMPTVTTKGAELAQAPVAPVISIEIKQELVEVDEEKEVRIPTVPAFTDVERVESDPESLPVAPLAGADDGAIVPRAPFVTVKDFAVRRPAVPSAPLFFSTKSVPSHSVPDMPILAVKSITHIVPIAPPFVIVYDDQPGFNDYTAPTIKPRAAQKSEKKTDPTQTSSSK